MYLILKILFDANGELYDSNDDLNEGSTEGAIETSRRRTRKSNFYLQVRTTSGRAGINSIDAQLALVGG